jgi:hypothetical protein
MLTRCDISGNVTESSGAGLKCYHATPVLTECTIADNTTDGQRSRGGGIYCDHSSPVLTDCTISGNVALGDPGGGIYCTDQSAPELRRCVITANRGGRGGGIYCEHASSPVLTECAIDRNEGHGLYCRAGSSPLLTDCTLNENSIFGYNGGGVACSDNASPELVRCTISGNSSGTGAGVWCLESSPLLARCVITGNRARNGGGVYSYDASPVLVECTIHANSAWEDSAAGGGVCLLGGTPELLECAISGNQVRGIAPQGGGVFCAGGSAKLIRCIVSGNLATGLAAEGGGMYLFCHPGGDTVEVTNCAIAGNSSRYGAGVYCRGGSPRLTHCTLAENTASESAGGCCCNTSSPVLRSCVLAHNVGGSMHLSDALSAPQISFSCVEGDEPWPGEGNILGDPRFALSGDWQDCDPASGLDCIPSEWKEGYPVAWGRWVADYRLEPDSPCIDAGAPEAAPAVDLDGRDRPCGRAPDIGAYEAGDCLLAQPFRRGDANADGGHDLSDALYILGYLFQGGPASPCERSADSDDSGTVDISDAIRLLGFLFLGGGPPAAPFPDCGLEAAPGDGLSCHSYAPCGEP